MLARSPYTPNMREVHRIAHVELAARRNEEVRPEDFLLAIIRRGDCFATQLLSTFHVDREALRQKLEDLIERSKSYEPDSANQILVDAKAIATGMKHGWVGTEHLLLALVKSQTSAGDLLRNSGVEFEKAQVEVVRVIEAHSPPPRQQQQPRPAMADSWFAIDRYARELAKERGTELTTELILLAMVVKEPKIREFLAGYGIDEARLRKEFFNQ